MKAEAKSHTVSYDWHKGYQFAGPSNSNQIFLHATKEDEVKRRAPKK
jgi:mRNA export factor